MMVIFIHYTYKLGFRNKMPSRWHNEPLRASSYPLPPEYTQTDNYNYMKAETLYVIATKL